MKLSVAPSEAFPVTPSDAFRAGRSMGSDEDCRRSAGNQSARLLSSRSPKLSSTCGETEEVVVGLRVLDPEPGGVRVLGVMLVLDSAAVGVTGTGGLTFMGEPMTGRASEEEGANGSALGSP